MLMLPFRQGCCFNMGLFHTFVEQIEAVSASEEKERWMILSLVPFGWKPSVRFLCLFSRLLKNCREITSTRFGFSLRVASGDLIRAF